MCAFANNEVIGLDIGSAAVKIVQLSRSNGDWSVTAAGIADIAEGAGSDRVLRKAGIVKAIKDCLRSSGVRTQMAVCGVSGEQVAVRCFRFASLTAEEIEGAVRLEASQVCPFEIDDCSISYQLTSESGEDVSGILAVATRNVVEAKKQYAGSASLDAVLIDVDGLALLNCLDGLESGEDDRKAGRGARAILCVGSSYTTLAIKGPGGLAFVRDISYAGNDIIEQIAKKNGAAPEQISRILSGYEDCHASEIELHDDLANASEGLILDITETLRYYNAQQKGVIVEKIFVCGGFGLIKGFVELLDSGLGVKAVLWNPFEKIGCRGDRLCREIVAEKGPAMAVAAGLAMRSF